MIYNCPKCHKPMEPTESEGLWCVNGCYTEELNEWEVTPSDSFELAIEKEIVRCTEEMKKRKENNK